MPQHEQVVREGGETLSVDERERRRPAPVVWAQCVICAWEASCSTVQAATVAVDAHHADTGHTAWMLGTTRCAVRDPGARG